MIDELVAVTWLWALHGCTRDQKISTLRCIDLYKMVGVLWFVDQSAIAIVALPIFVTILGRLEIHQSPWPRNVSRRGLI